MRKNFIGTVLIAFACVFIATGLAHAEKLEVAADAPMWAHLGAGALLYLHIGGGIVGLLTGLLAFASKKGSFLHRSVGKLFVLSMAITYLIGAGVAPFLTEGQRPNFVAGILALYLLISGWLAARHAKPPARWQLQAGLLTALIIAALGLVFMQMGAGSPTGTVDGSPPQAFLIFAFFGSLAAIGELNFLIRRELSGTARITRHLWRMCASMFFASGSLFLGQPQVFPEWFATSPMPILLAFLPLLAMLYWAGRVRFKSTA
jgi:uncharacterized membrane protein